MGEGVLYFIFIGWKGCHQEIQMFRFVKLQCGCLPSKTDRIDDDQDGLDLLMIDAASPILWAEIQEEAS